MATAQQIKALLKSYGEADGEMFVSVALQIAAHEARGGKAKLANELKKLVDEIREKQRTAKVGGAVPIARPRGELAHLLAATYPRTTLGDMVLSEEQRQVLEQVLLEYRQEAKLKEFALSARRKLLLVGPPGVGKTMTSHALAGELKLPHFTVQFHSLITKYMGETAAKLFAIFESMKLTRGVYLFDEFDAIGAMRAGRNDVGEIRRVLNSFLQFLEQDDSESLVVAATNMNELLDNALYRRFDDVITYKLPAKGEIVDVMANRLSAFAVEKRVVSEVAEKAVGLSHAQVCRACDDAAKKVVLADARKISATALSEAIVSRRAKEPSK